MHSLALFHRIAGTRVVVVGDGVAAEAKRRLIERAGGTFCSEAEAHHARLALIALEDRGAAEVVARRLKQRGLLVNVADHPDLCDFTLPSLLERGPVMVAVATGGASAGLAKQLRLRLEALLPASLGLLAERLGTTRDMLRARWPDPAQRRAMLDRALAEGGPLDPLAETSPDAIEPWLAGAPQPAGMEREVIQLASDDPDDLTLRQARLLGRADVILHDPDVPAAILARARADALRRLLPGDSAPDEGLTVVIRSPPSDRS